MHAAHPLRDRSGAAGPPGGCATVHAMSDQVRLTRRGLFRGLGSATLLSGPLSGCKPTDTQATTTTPEGPAAPEGIAGVGPGPAALQFTLNGEAKTLEVAPHVTLLAALREHVHATGTKVVCDRGACGACTVLVDGVARNSCMMLAHDVAGAQVTTVEGLGAHDKLSPLQQAFVRHDALQCGFCTSGMLMSCESLLRRKRSGVTREDVEAAIAGNLCRCGTYPNVVAAVLDVAKGTG